MLTMYPKNVSDNIPAHVLRKIRVGDRQWLGPFAETSELKSSRGFGS
jgi:hypothetical protein